MSFVCRTGARNLITDVPGICVGNAEDKHIKSGTTVLFAEKPFVASVDVMGGAPGTRETDCLEADKLVSDVDALVLSGGSAFGLSAACGVADALRDRGRGFKVGPVRVPIVPAAILFDLLNGGNKAWTRNPYPELGRCALAACDRDFALGTVGAGCGATTANLKGGLGSASVVLPTGHTLGALVAVNAHGSVVASDGHFHAAPYEINAEFGGLGVSDAFDPLALPKNEKLAAFNARAHTTLAIVATDALLAKSELKRLAIAAQDGLARAILPAHTLFDGDVVFSLATGCQPLKNRLEELALLGHVAAQCLARAVCRGMFLATAAPDDTLDTWQGRYADDAQHAGR